MQSSGFSVAISATDAITGPISTIGEQLRKLTRSFGDFQKQAETTRPAPHGGSFFDRARFFSERDARGATRGVHELGREVRETGRHVADAFEPLSAFGGEGGRTVAGFAAGGIAGMAANLEKFSQSTAELGRTSQRIGISAQALEKMDNAAQLAGVPVGAMTSALAVLQRRLEDANLGRDNEAIRAFGQLHIATQNIDLSTRSAIGPMKELSAAIVGQKNPATQLRIATTFLGDSLGQAVLPFLQRGPKGVEELAREVERLNKGVTTDGVKAATAYEEAQNAVIIAIRGVGRAMAEDLHKPLTPLLKDFAEWVKHQRETPGRLDAIEKGAAALAVVLGVESAIGLGSVVVKLGAAFVGFNATLGATLLGGLSAVAAVFMFVPDSLLTSEQVKGRQEWFGKFQGGMRNLLTGGSAGGSGGGGGYSFGMMKTLALNAGFKGADADKMAAIGMVESSGNPRATNLKGEESYGLTQINAKAWGSQAREAYDNPQRAFDLAHMVYEKQGWSAWKNSLPGAESYLAGAGGSFKAEPLSGAAGLGGGGSAADLVKYAIPGREESAAGANPEFAGRLGAMFAAMPSELRSGIKINNAYRDLKTQEQLYAASHGSGMVAPPGSSMHNFGLAADLGGSDLARKGAALEWVHQHAAEFGLGFPMGKEPWHIEPAELRTLGREEFLKKYGSAAAGLMEAYGDSIAVGVKKAGKLAGDALGGRRTDEVLDALSKGSLSGKSVILSSGVSNDVDQGLGFRPDVVRRQLDLLDKAHARGILLGVGAGVKGHMDINRQLGEMAKERGIPFTGVLETTERNGGVVHPTIEGYGQVLEHAKRSFDLSSGAAKHQVQVNITGAPEGTRTSVSEAEGPASVSLKTRYGYGDLSAARGRAMQTGI